MYRVCARAQHTYRFDCLGYAILQTGPLKPLLVSVMIPTDAAGASSALEASIHAAVDCTLVLIGTTAMHVVQVMQTELTGQPGCRTR